MLSDELRRRFELDGFVVLRRALPGDLIIGLRHAVEVIYGYELRRGVELTDTGLWGRIPVAERIGRHPSLVSTARGLLDCSSVRLWQDQLIAKRPHTGSSTELHRDAPYWPMVTATAVTCWLPLDGVDATSGAMCFAPGSHRRGIRHSMLPLAAAELMGAADGEADRNAPPSTLELVPLSSGDCTFHSGLIVHGACANTSPHPRLAYKLVYMADGTKFRLQWHSATAESDLKDGDPIVGPGFPVLA